MSFYTSINRQLERMPGSWLIFVGALCWSTAGAVVKNFETNPLFLVGLRSLLAGLTLSFAIRPRKIRFDKWLLFLVLFATGMMVCAITSFRLTSATLVIAMQYTAPIWLFFFNWLVNRKLEKSRLPVMLLIVAGILLFLLEPADGATATGNLLALNMGLCFAGVSVCMKRMKHDNPLGVVALMNLGTALIVLPFCLILPGVSLHVGVNDWLYILYLAIFQLSAGYLFYMLGLKKVTPQKGALLCVWELVLTPVWAFLIVHEIPSFFVAAGALTMVAALFGDNYVDHIGRTHV
ncbi:MAG: DMT family transporter [Clostridiales bacterium]|nr:DMT family transporter [Clostridiales bacterium]